MARTKSAHPLDGIELPQDNQVMKISLDVDVVDELKKFKEYMIEVTGNKKVDESWIINSSMKKMFLHAQYKSWKSEKNKEN